MVVKKSLKEIILAADNRNLVNIAVGDVRRVVKTYSMSV